MQMTFEVSGKTDIGCIRSNNEDSFGYDTEIGLFVVCDGMGGAAAGEVASQIGVDSILSHFRRSSTHCSLTGDELARAIRSANKRISESARDNPQRSGMGTTIVAALLHDRIVSIAHVGDSRIYLIRDGAAQQLTVDHSLVMEHLRLGYISRDEAESSRLQNVITRALGTESAEPELAEVSMLPYDVLLLCTDGLTRHVPDSLLSELIDNAASLDAACSALVEAAKTRGGSDNITCVLVKCVPARWYRGWFRASVHGS
jgi:protein phosphatase